MRVRIYLNFAEGEMLARIEDYHNALSPNKVIFNITYT
jgi:hypothetical protein